MVGNPELDNRMLHSIERFSLLVKEIYALLPCPEALLLVLDNCHVAYSLLPRQIARQRLGCSPSRLADLISEQHCLRKHHTKYSAVLS